MLTLTITSHAPNKWARYYDQLFDAFESAYRAMDLSYCAADALDSIALMTGLTRMEGEPDNALRDRVEVYTRLAPKIVYAPGSVMYCEGI